MLGYPLHDPLNLGNGFPLAKDHLRNPLADATVIVDLRIAQVIKRKLSQPQQSGLYVEPTILDPLQEIHQGFLVHVVTSFA